LKLDKKIDKKKYSVALMAKELETMSICTLIAQKFNERMIDKV
jgi:hypothetical protein